MRKINLKLDHYLTPTYSFIIIFFFFVSSRTLNLSSRGEFLLNSCQTKNIQEAKKKKNLVTMVENLKIIL